MTELPTRVVLESWRVRHAASFAPRLAANAARIDPLPHQLHAVYEVMLPRRPLRMLLADDPGAGKTIMAGLLITELLARGRALRCVVVAPGSLVDQWRDELASKFSLDLPIADRDTLRDPGWLDANPRIIARLDQCARDEALRERLAGRPWDLAVFDEAHRLSTSWSGQKQDRTQRYRFAQALCRAAEDVLLMSATPHSGDEEDFQSFLQLLDPDRFEGRYRPAAHRIRLDDLVLRRVKEDLRRFDGTELFPPRRASTLRFELSPGERALYDSVTRYVQEQFDRADTLNGARSRTVGFALTVLQRRLASSPAAIARSLRARHARLGERLAALASPRERDLDDADDADLAGEAAERRDDELVEVATASRSREELAREVQTLGALAAQAQTLLDAREDRKREAVVELLGSPEMRDPSGRRRKLVIFTEHLDTLRYIAERLSELRGRPECVRAIHGAMDRAERLEAQRDFTERDEVEFLVATDAAGEGINLQRASLVLNWDIPWVPAKLEQRFGRVHRIGQTETCHLFNLVALGTRETEVLDALCRRLEEESKSLQGKVFDVLGAAFDERPLRELLVSAVRGRGAPRGLAEGVDHAIDAAVGRQGSFSQRTRAPAEDGFAREARAALDRSRAQGMGHAALSRWFRDATAALGARAYPVEGERYRLNHVPPAWSERASGMPRRKLTLSLRSAAHPWVRALADAVLARVEGPRVELAVDPWDESAAPTWLVACSQRLRVGDDTLAERAWIARVSDEGRVVSEAIPAHLDLRAPTEAEGQGVSVDAAAVRWLLGVVDGALAAPWRQALSSQHAQREDHAAAEACARLSAELQFTKVRAEEAAHRGRGDWSAIAREERALRERLLRRQGEAERARRVFAEPLVCVGAIRVIPGGVERTAHERAVAWVRELAAMRGDALDDVRAARAGWDLAARRADGALCAWVVRSEGALSLRETEAIALAQAPEQVALLVVPAADDGRAGIPVEVRGAILR